MQLAAATPLAAWQNFYVIIGTAAATLTGLTFVIISLLPAARVHGSSGAIGAFTAPTVVHFSLALLISALFNVPWQALWQLGLLLSLVGLGGMLYVIFVVGIARRQTDYQMVLEDWLWYMTLPLVAHIALLIAAILLLLHLLPALFGIAAATLLLLFTSIHNAWDAVTYIIIVRSQPENEGQN